jgi:hypothetical protein
VDQTACWTVEIEHHHDDHGDAINRSGDGYPPVQ